MQIKKQIVGWREWVGLPELGIDAIKAKVDTGALTSALHAIHVRPFQENGQARVKFDIHPLQRRSDVTVQCVADIIDEREIRSSNGHVELRPVIHTLLRLGEDQWPIELTLTNRDSMGFRMLLGRRAMRRHLIVDPSVSYVFGRKAR